jgi:multiple sugar transport system permease protein
VSQEIREIRGKATYSTSPRILVPKRSGLLRNLGVGIPVIAMYVVLIGGALAFVAPALWMLSTSLKTNTQLYRQPSDLLPNPIYFANYRVALLETAPFILYLRNSLIVTLTGVVGEVGSSALVAFAFARLRWVGRDFWFGLCLATLLLPGQVTLIPLFILFTRLGWVNTFLPLIVPAFFGVPFYIFLLRQFFLGLPRDFDDAAVVDGASTAQIFTQVIVPLSLPALAACAIFSFVGRWNDFLGPLIYLRDDALYTLQLGLLHFYGTAGPEWQLTMAASTVIMLPCLVMFFLAQRFFVRGIILTGLKG